MKLTYRGAFYSTSPNSSQTGVSAIGTYRGTTLMLGVMAPAQPVLMTLRYRGISYQSAD